MSIRPSSIYNSGQLLSSDNVDVQAFVIIGNTALATIYALKTIAAYPTTPIYVLTMGTNQTSNVNAIESLQYVAENTQLMLRNLNVERLHLILPSNAGL